MVQNMYAYDQFSIDLSVEDGLLMKEGPVVGRVIAETGSVEDLYAMKGKAGLGLRRQRAPVPPRRLLQERDAKPVRLCILCHEPVHRGPVRRNLFIAICTPWAIRRAP